MSSSGTRIAYNDFDHDVAFLLAQVLKLLYLRSALMAEHNNSPSAPSKLGCSCMQKFHLSRRVVDLKLLGSLKCMHDDLIPVEKAGQVQEVIDHGLRSPYHRKEVGGGEQTDRKQHIW